MDYDTFNKFFYPIEIKLNQNIKSRDEELQNLIHTYNNKELKYFIKSMGEFERNKSFRWNAFYPLYDLLSKNFNEIKITSKDRSELLFEFIILWIEEYLYKCKANSFVWYDMADAFRLIFFHKVMSLYRNKLSKRNKRKIEYAILIHEYFLLKDELLQQGNHRIFQVIARIIIFSVRKNNSLLEKEKQSLITLFNSQFTDQGYHVEHSPEYHLWANWIFLELRRMYNLKGIDKKLDKITLNSGRFFTPDRKIPLIGDSGIDNINSYYDKFYSEISDGTEISKDYIISTTNEKGWYFICLISKNSDIHKHKDSSSFELFFRGRKVITDCGKYSYERSEFSASFRNEISHNIIQLKDDLGLFSMSNYKIISNKKYKGVEVYTLQAKSGDSIHTRRFIHNSNDQLIIIDNIENRNNELCSNLNLVKGETYQLLKKENDSIFYYSTETGCEISFYNVKKTILNEIKVSEKYLEYSEEKSICAYSKNNMIISAIGLGRHPTINHIDENRYNIVMNNVLFCTNNKGGLDIN